MVSSPGRGYAGYRRRQSRIMEPDNVAMETRGSFVPSVAHPWSMDNFCLWGCGYAYTVATYTCRRIISW